MDSVVQLVRNFLCCMKDLEVFPTSFLHDANVTAQFYHFPAPLDQTTPLEFAISWCQFYPFVFLTKAGIGMTINGMRTAHKCSNLLEEMSSTKDSSTTTFTHVPCTPVMGRTWQMYLCIDLL